MYKEPKRLILEGIDVDNLTKTISYNPNHQERVNTSEKDNPSIQYDITLDAEVWSIFQRKRALDDRLDGNPLLYAMKGEKNWKFRSEYDKKCVLKQIHLIAKKFADTHPFDVTVIIPSTNALNETIAEIITTYSKNAKIIEGVIDKIKTKEIEEYVYEDGCPFREYYGKFGRKALDNAYKKFSDFLNKMDELKGGYFVRHLIKDDTMRDLIDKTFKVNDDYVSKYFNDIHDRHVLLVDDNISRGQSIREACRILKDTYLPASITVLTLMSKVNPT